jgi:hypothetical protein
LTIIGLFYAPLEFQPKRCPSSREHPISTILGSAEQLCEFEFWRPSPIPIEPLELSIYACTFYICITIEKNKHTKMHTP